MLLDLVYFLNNFVLWYLIFISFGYVILLGSSIPYIFQQFSESEFGDLNQLMSSLLALPVTVIICAYNEEKDIINSIYSVLKSTYQEVHIIVVNDGSTDGTLPKLKQAFDLKSIEPILVKKVKTTGLLKNYFISNKRINISVIDKENSGKSDSLNMALNLCRTPLFVTLDADTLLEPDAITNAVFYMLSHPNTLAVGGAVYILNGCEVKDGEILEKKISLNPLYALQTCEYLRSFLFSRSGWNAFSGALSFAGAFTLFDYKAVIDVGGFDHDNLAQDFEIATHLHEYAREQKRDYTIGYTAAAAAWTDAPGSFKEYWRQRYNWQKDTLRSLLLHKKMCFNPKYGLTGLFTYPFYLFGETLGVCVEFLAYLLVFASWYLGILDIYWVFLLITICWGFISVLTMATALMSFVTYNKYQKINDLLWFFLIVFLENFGFRQFLISARIAGTFGYFFGKKSKTT